MDDIVRQAIAKWPNVPDCYGWLGLDARGNWYMRDDQAQAAGSFSSSFSPEKAAASGQWFFQNGPQRVYVELQATPLIWRIDAAPTFAVTSHTGQPARVQRCLVDEWGRVYLETEVGFGLVHTQDMTYAADAVEQGLWVPEEVFSRDLPARFGYVRSPQTLQKT
jgi:hypothetical protein